MTNPDVFVFVDRKCLTNLSGRVAVVPSSLTSKEMLLESLGTSLALPLYFGKNWDALSDCLRDLSWIPERRITIVHTGVPRMGVVAFRAYLRVLADAVLDWLPGETHEIVVIFPSDVEAQIARLLLSGDDGAVRGPGDG